MQGKITTVQQHILDEERMHPEATGDFTALLTTLTLAAKIISREVNKAGLVKILGDTGEINVQGEAVQKLDEFAQHTICRAMGHNGHLCVMASEESEDIIPIPDGSKRGKYVLMFDPLDGSSNIDVNASIGTIFSIHRKITKNVFASLAPVRNRNDIFGLFGSHYAQMPVVTHRTADRVLGELIKLLDGFTLYIDLTGVTQDLHQAGLVDFTRNDLCRQRQRGQDSRKVSGRFRMHPLFIENMLLNCCDFSLHGSNLILCAFYLQTSIQH